MIEPQAEPASLELLLSTMNHQCPDELLKGRLLQAFNETGNASGSSLKVWAGCSDVVLTFQFHRDSVSVRWLDNQVTVPRSELEAALAAMVQQSSAIPSGEAGSKVPMVA